MGEHLWTEDANQYRSLTGVDPTPIAKDALAQLTVSDYLAPVTIATSVANRGWTWTSMAAALATTSSPATWPTSPSWTIAV